MKATMKRGTRNVVFLSVILLLVISACSQKDVSKEIQKENDQISAAIVNGSFDELISRYTEDGMIIPPNAEPMIGREAISLMWQTIKTMGVTNMQFKTISAEQHGNVAIEHGMYKLFAGEDILIDHGKYIVIWEKKGGMWMIKKDIWNTSMPPAPMAQVNDTIMFFSFRFKESDSKKLDAFNETYFTPAMKEFQPDVLKRITLAEDIKSDNGYITRYYFVFPYHSSDDFDIKSVVMKKFNGPGIEEKISDIYSLYKILDLRYAVVRKK